MLFGFAILCIRATDSPNSRQHRYNTKAGLTVLLSSQMALRECGGGLLKVSQNEIMMKIREEFELSQSRYRYRDANPCEITFYWFHWSEKEKKMFFLFILFGQRYVTSIKITK